MQVVRAQGQIYLMSQAQCIKSFRQHICTRPVYFDNFLSNRYAKHGMRTAYSRMNCNKHSPPVILSLTHTQSEVQSAEFFELVEI